MANRSKTQDNSELQRSKDLYDRWFPLLHLCIRQMEIWVSLVYENIFIYIDNYKNIVLFYFILCFKYSYKNNV